MLTKTPAVIAIAEEIVERAAVANPGDRSFLEMAISSYLSAMAYAETEQKVSDILRNRFHSNDDQKLGHFLTETYGKGKGRIAKSDIANLAKQFGPNCKDEFNQLADGRAVTRYSNLLDCRHKLAHGEPRPESLAGIKEGVTAAQELLDALEEAIK